MGICIIAILNHVYPVIAHVPAVPILLATVLHVPLARCSSIVHVWMHALAHTIDTIIPIPTLYNVSNAQTTVSHASRQYLLHLQSSVTHARVGTITIRSPISVCQSAPLTPTYPIMWIVSNARPIAQLVHRLVGVVAANQDIICTIMSVCRYAHLITW